MSKIEIEIEKGIPLPRKNFIKPRTELGQLVDIFSEMVEGDSIVVSEKQANSLCSSVIRKKRWSAPRRKLSDGNYRVWKIKRDNDA